MNTNTTDIQSDTLTLFHQPIIINNERLQDVINAKNCSREEAIEAITYFLKNVTFDLDTDDEIIECDKLPKEVETVTIVCEGILSIIFALLGLTGNMLTAFVLCQRTFQTTFHRIILSLLTYDTIFIGNNLFAPWVLYQLRLLMLFLDSLCPLRK